ncbi:MAG: hypothetical protein FIB02_06380 [Desulfuromonas sp.]|nr:hypothetical protein [Desulfuromonas sp.]
MPKAGDTFTVILRKSHLEWGTHRYTSTRGTVYGEGYLPIPVVYARRFEIYNSNKDGSNIEYICNTSDKFLCSVKLKASGSSHEGAVYAKQFQGSGNLKLLGDWFSHINANVGDKIKVTWISQKEIILTKC